MSLDACNAVQYVMSSSEQTPIDAKRTRMARTPATSGLSVYQIFNLCQKSIAAHTKCAALLWQLEQSNSNTCLADILTCIKHVLAIPQVRFGLKQSLITETAGCHGADLEFATKQVVHRGR